MTAKHIPLLFVGIVIAAAARFPYRVARVLEQQIKVEYVSVLHNAIGAWPGVAVHGPMSVVINSRQVEIKPDSIPSATPPGATA